MTILVSVLAALSASLAVELWLTKRRLWQAEQELERVISGETNVKPRWLYPGG